MQPAKSVMGQSGEDAAGDIRPQLLANIPVEERKLQIAGISTALLEGGSGDPIVLLHGPGEYAAKWLRVIPDFVNTHHVVAPDLPGHGLSEPVNKSLTVEEVLAWLDELIDLTCTRPPIVVGQILGGAIAARYASKHGDKIKQLILSDTLGLTVFQPRAEFGKALMDFMSDPTEDTHDRLWARCAFNLDELQRGMGKQWTLIKAYNMKLAHQSSLRETQHALIQGFGIPEIPSEELTRIAVPTALIWGRHDLATGLDVAESVSARFGWPLHVIENAADDPPMEQPDQFIRALRRILSSPSETPAVIDRTRDTRAAWDRIAKGYDRTNTPSQMWLGSEGLRRVGLRSGMRFLDVAAGSGALSIPAARLGAKVLAIDQSTVMLELLSARAGQEGLEIETRVMDGHALEIGDDGFDMAGSQFGVMLFPDMPRGIREMVRVVKPGGRVLIHAYGDPHRIEFLGFFVDAIRSVRPEFDGPPSDPPPLEFQLADPKRLHEELAKAGLKNIHVESIIETTGHRSGQDLWEWLVWSNPLAEQMLSDLLQLTNEEREIVRRELDKMVAERAGTDECARLSNPVNIGIGTKL